MTARLTDLKAKALQGSKGERGWAAQQLAPLRAKIAGAVRVLGYIADKRQMQPLDGRAPPQAATCRKD